MNSWQNVPLVSTAHALVEVPHHASRHLRVQRSDSGVCLTDRQLFRGGCRAPCVDLLLDNVPHAFYGPDLRGIGRYFSLSLKCGITAHLGHWSIARARCALTRSGQNIFPLLCLGTGILKTLIDNMPPHSMIFFNRIRHPVLPCDDEKLFWRCHSGL